MAKIISVDQAVDLIRDGMTVGVSGFGAFSSPDSILEAIGQRYRERRTPKDLTIVSGWPRGISRRTAAACPRSPMTAWSKR